MDRDEQIAALEAGAEYAASQQLDRTTVGRALITFSYRCTEAPMRWAAHLLRTGALQPRKVAKPDSTITGPWSRALDVLAAYGYQHK